VAVGDAFDVVLGAAQVGAAWALERLYADLAPAVVGYLRAQGAVEPDDLTNEVFERAFTRIVSFSGNEAMFRSWVFTIAHHRLVDDRRRSARRPRSDSATGVETIAAPGGDVEEEALRRLSDDRVRRLCERLVPDQRSVLLLRMVGGLSIEQTAEAIGKSPGAVKALQHRAVATLRRLVEREGVSL
jgi:RNA polymerase sigma factor (sigma-70 family)